jgi:hypothetical protein
MWNVNPRKMCNQHILGEHVEMHMFAGTIKKGISISGYINKGLVETGYIKQRHDILVREMARRGINHSSDIDDNNYNEEVGTVNKAENEIILSNRCPDCKKLMEAFLEDGN